MNATIPEAQARALLQMHNLLAKASDAIEAFSAREHTDGEMRLRAKADRAMAILGELSKSAIELSNMVDTEAMAVDVERAALYDDVAAIVDGVGDPS